MCKFHIRFNVVCILMTFKISTYVNMMNDLIQQNRGLMLMADKQSQLMTCITRSTSDLYLDETLTHVCHECHRFIFYFFHNTLGSEDEIKIKNRIHSDHFPIELKSKETRNRTRILIQLENGPNEFYFYFSHLTRCCHWG